MGLVAKINAGAKRVPPWLIYMVGFGWSAWLFWQAMNGHLGADPVKGLERALGLLGLKLLVAGLCVTPLRKYVGVNLIKFRRALGLTAFYYIGVHFLTWIALDMGLLLSQVLADIFKRPYVTIGMAGLVLLIPLAITSNNKMVRRLGTSRWQRLHMLTYLAVPLGGLHFIWLVKAWPPEPFVYMGIILALLATRLPMLYRRIVA